MSRHERSERAWRDWLALPIEARVVTVAVPATLFFVAHVAQGMEVVQDAVGSAEITAAATIGSILTILMVQLTFGRAVKAQQEKMRSVRALTASLGADSGIGAGGLVNPVIGRSVRAQLDALQRHDPGFSEVLLGTWLRALIGRIAATAPADRSTLAPFVAHAVWPALEGALGGADRVLVGPIHVVEVHETPTWNTLRIDAAVLIARQGSLSRTAARWTLRRAGGARTAGPADLLSFACPACGAPVQVTGADGVCVTCGIGVAHGQMAWQLILLDVYPDAPLAPDGAPDAGGAHPSVELEPLAEPSLDAGLRALRARHPDLDLDALSRLAARAAIAWVDALDRGDTSPLAPLATDDLVAAARHEIGRHRATRRDLRAAGASAHEVAWTRVARDGWHELAEFRVVLTGPWSVVDADGTVVDGHPTEPRSWALYVRLAHPVGGPVHADGFRLWSVASVHEYAK